MSDYQDRLEQMSTAQLEKELQRTNVREGHWRAVQAELARRECPGAADQSTLPLPFYRNK